MGNPLWSKQLSESLMHYIGEAGMNKIMKRCDRLEELDEKAKAEWIKKAIAKIDERVVDEKIKMKIMTECSWLCFDEYIKGFKDIYKKSKDIDELMEAMHGKVFLVRPIREGNIVYITKAPRFPEEYRKAKTAEEKRYYFCHCDYVRAASGKISPTYCYCSAGWCKRIWEGVLEKPVCVDIIKTVLQDDDICQFAVYI